MNTFLRSLAVITTLLLPLKLNAQTYLDLVGLSPYTHYQTFETQHFKMVYANGYLDFTQKAAEYLEQAHTVLSPLLKWQPRGKTTVLVADNEDSANGLTMPALRVGLVLIATPPDAYLSTSYSDDWIKLLVFHEYTHFLNIDATTGWVEAARIIFGDVIRPNGLWPVWMLEGLAVYYETRTSKLGRGRSPYWDSILRAYYLEGKLGDEDHGITLDRVNGDYPYFPGGEIYYLFGYHLWNQFALDRKNDSDMGEYSMRSSHRVPYFIEGNLENVTGHTWYDYWNEFLRESQGRFNQQVGDIKHNPVSKTEVVDHSDYTSEGGALSPDQQWVATTETNLDRRSSLYLKNLKTGKKTWIIDKLLGLGLAFTPDSKYLVFSALNRVGTYQLYSDLFYYDLKKEKVQRLTEGLRAKDPSISSDGKSIVFLRVDHATHLLAQAELKESADGLQVGPPTTIHQPSPFSILGTPRFTEEGTIVFSQQEHGKTFSDLMEIRNHSPRVLFHDGAMNRYPLPANHRLYFISDRTGVENLYELNKGSATRVSNVLTGLSFPFAQDREGRVYADLMSSNGYQMVRLAPLALAKASQDVKLAGPSAPESRTEALQPATGISPKPEPYSAWSSMAPREWAPLAYATNGSKSGLTVGGFVLGFDSTGKQQYVLESDYNFTPKTWDGSIAYTFYYFRPSITLSADAYTSDIAGGPLGTSYKRGYETELQLAYPIRYTYSTLTPRIYGFYNWNGMFDINSGNRVTTNDFEYANPSVPGYGASLSFTDAESSKLGFMPERGNDVVLAAENRINEGHYDVLKYLASYSHYFKVGDHSVLKPKARWLGSTHPALIDRTYALLEGKRTADATDNGTREGLSRLGLRGYSNVTIYTRGAGIGSLDYFFPAYRIFSGFGDTSPFFFKQLYIGVFADTAVIPSARYGALTLPSFGGSVSLDTTLLIRVPAKFTFEYQKGTRKDFGGDDVLFLGIQSSSLY